MTLWNFIIAEVGIMAAIWLIWNYFKAEPIRTFISGVLVLVAVFILLKFCGVLNVVGG